MTTRIDIVGGGIAGLALAAALDPSRFDVTLHEGRPDRRGLGTALAMWPPAQRALTRIGADGVLERAVGVTGAALADLDERPLVVPRRMGQVLRFVSRISCWISSL